MNTTTPARPIFARIEFVVAIIISVVIGYLHLVVLRHAGALWDDEIHSLNTGLSASLTHLWNVLYLDGSPALSYLLLRGWTAVMGSGDSALRVYGFFVGISIVAALWFNARMMGRSLPLISLAVFGMNAIVITNGDTLRAYGVGTLFMLLALGFVWKFVLSPSRPIALLALLSVVAATQCLYQNACFVLGICAGAMLITYRRGLWKQTGVILAIGAFAAVLLIPYIPVIQKEQLHLVIDEPGLPWAQAGQMASGTLNSSGGFPGVVWGILLVLGAGIAVAVQFPKGFVLPVAKRELALFIGVALMVSLVGFIIFSKSAGCLVSGRHFILPLALAAVFLDVMVAVLSETMLRRWLVLCISVTIVAVSFSTAHASCRLRNTNMDGITSKLETLAGEKDLIAVCPFYGGVTFRRYYRGTTRWITVPEFKDTRLARYDELKVKMSTPKAAASALEKITQVLKSGNKVWLVGAPAFLAPGQMPPSLPPPPAGPQGWYQVPYAQMWVMETSYLLQTHAGRSSVVFMPASQSDLNRFETFPLTVYEGWR